MKKFLTILRFWIIGSLWTCCFVIFSNYAICKIWNFDFMSAHSWHIISSFWNAGGTIKTASDYIFIIVLLSLPFIWIMGWKKLLQIKYIPLLLSPIILYNRHIINKYGEDSPRIVLRNIKSSQKIIEEIKDQLDSIKPAKTKKSQNIRAEVKKTLSNINKS